VPNYQHYGARGITYDPRWDDFTIFLADVGEPPAPGMTIDRINNDGNYEVGNIRWATRAEQSRNTRRCHYLTFQDKTQTVAEWSTDTGLAPSTIRKRLNRGFSVEQALTMPKVPTGGKHNQAPTGQPEV
jgi:hypothetical protein